MAHRSQSGTSLHSWLVPGDLATGLAHAGKLTLWHLLPLVLFAVLFYARQLLGAWADVALLLAYALAAVAVGMLVGAVYQVAVGTYQTATRR